MLREHCGVRPPRSRLAPATGTLSAPRRLTRRRHTACTHVAIWRGSASKHCQAAISGSYAEVRSSQRQTRSWTWTDTIDGRPETRTCSYRTVKVVVHEDAAVLPLSHTTLPNDQSIQRPRQPFPGLGVQHFRYRYLSDCGGRSSASSGLPEGRQETHRSDTSA